MSALKAESDERKLLITFRLGSKTYGINIFEVQEVLHFQKIILIPNTLKFVDGIIRTQDRTIPVVDLRKRFGVRGDNKSKRRIMILDPDNQYLGIIVDDISDVLIMDTLYYKALSEVMVNKCNKACVTRMIKHGSESINVISPELILTAAENQALKGFQEKHEWEDASLPCLKRKVIPLRRPIISRV